VSDNVEKRFETDIHICNEGFVFKKILHSIIQFTRFIFSGHSQIGYHASMVHKPKRNTRDLVA
jgi:hypothetical protein